jgi:homoaconitase/3-isopropylmalate dehydratase large subunit
MAAPTLRVISSTTPASIERARAARARVRMEHRLRQIDRIMTQEVLTPDALRQLDEEKRTLQAQLQGPRVCA